ncbi:MAG: ABC transporter substrate-binding protein, partial [Acidimicrobiia bacterium]|nr:ABC transporter substrate-binding protein [Acidimicrobiia bacterium]
MRSPEQHGFAKTPNIEEGGEMRRVILIALLAIMAVALTACGSGTKEVTSATNNAKVFTTGTPTKEIPSVKWYTFYRGVLGLVAATWVDYPELMVNANLCESIVRAQPDYSIVPGLANFVVSDDYKTYTYTLRDGAAFWNGAPVTAQDVLFSIKANTTPPFGGANFQIADEIASMNAVDDKTVKIELKFSDINFNGLLAGTSGKIYEKKQAKTAGDKWGSPGVGVECTGPYKLGEWDPATSLTITRNDTYWGPDFKPLAKEVVFTWPQEPTMVKTAFETGELTGGWNVPPSVIAPLQSSGSGQMFVGASDTAVQMYALIVADVKKGNLADPRMRQAISLLIDRNAVASKIYNGAA